MAENLKAGSLEFDIFMMNEFRISRCPPHYGLHGSTYCLYSHPGNTQRRIYWHYYPKLCPYIPNCNYGERCQYAHNIYEYCLHPHIFKWSRCYHYSKCKVVPCMFSHHPIQLRQAKTNSPFHPPRLPVPLPSFKQPSPPRSKTPPPPPHAKTIPPPPRRCFTPPPLFPTPPPLLYHFSPPPPPRPPRPVRRPQPRTYLRPRPVRPLPHNLPMPNLYPGEMLPPPPVDPLAMSSPRRRGRPPLISMNMPPIQGLHLLTQSKRKHKNDGEASGSGSKKRRP